MVLKSPIVSMIDAGTSKTEGLILKIVLTGILVELDKISWNIGSYATITFNLAKNTTLNERVRAVKHYDSKARKKLCEFHFCSLSEGGREAMNRVLVDEHLRTLGKK